MRKIFVILSIIGFLMIFHIVSIMGTVFDADMISKMDKFMPGEYRKFVIGSIQGTEKFIEEIENISKKYDSTFLFITSNDPNKENTELFLATQQSEYIEHMPFNKAITLNEFISRKDFIGSKKTMNDVYLATFPSKYSFNLSPLTLYKGTPNSGNLDIIAPNQSIMSEIISELYTSSTFSIIDVSELTQFGNPDYNALILKEIVRSNPLKVLFFLLVVVQIYICFKLSRLITVVRLHGATHSSLLVKLIRMFVTPLIFVGTLVYVVSYYCLVGRINYVFYKLLPFYLKASLIPFVLILSVTVIMLLYWGSLNPIYLLKFKKVGTSSVTVVTILKFVVLFILTTALLTAITQFTEMKTLKQNIENNKERVKNIFTILPLDQMYNAVLNDNNENIYRSVKDMPQTLYIKRSDDYKGIPLFIANPNYINFLNLTTSGDAKVRLRIDETEAVLASEKVFSEINHSIDSRIFMNTRDALKEPKVIQLKKNTRMNAFIRNSQSEASAATPETDFFVVCGEPPVWTDILFYITNQTEMESILNKLDSVIDRSNIRLESLENENNVLLSYYNQQFEKSAIESIIYLGFLIVSLIASYVLLFSATKIEVAVNLIHGLPIRYTTCKAVLSFMTIDLVVAMVHYYLNGAKYTITNYIIMFSIIVFFEFAIWVILAIILHRRTMNVLKQGE